MEAAVQPFWDSANDVGSLKAGFLGFPGSGKTKTAAYLAIATRAVLGLDGPVAMFDTEGGSGYVKDLVLAKTGQPLLIKRARSFDDLMEFAKQVQQGGVSVAIVDSITHPWAELCESYLKQKNEALIAAQKKPVKRLEFPDWNVIKPTWAAWTNWYLNSPVSVIVCGRAGWEWDFEENEETGKKELRKTGIKMRTEGQFGFEPSLLIEMVSAQDLDGQHATIRREAVVLKDRFGVIDGKVFQFASLNDEEKELAAVATAFAPHVTMLKPGSNAPVDVRNKTEFNVDESGDAGWTREKREREILAEEIQGEMVAAYPGQSASEKKEKADLLLQVFQTRSWTAVENMNSDQLRAGLAAMRGILLSRLKAREPIPTEVANA